MPDLTLDWGAFGPFGTNVSGNETVDTGGVNVSVGFTAQDEDASAVTINAPGYVGPDEPFDDQSFLKLAGDGGDGGVVDTSTTTIDFSSSDDLYADEVQNVEFRLNDIDGGGDDIDPGTPDHQDIVTVRAYDAEGNEVPVSYSSGSEVDEAGNTLTGGDTNFDFQDGDASTLVSIAGPVSRIEIEYENGDIGEQAVMVSDVHFETIDASDNLAPTAAPDNASTEEDTAVIVDVTSNDTDPEGDDLTVSGVSDPANGSATVNTDGTVTYTPDTGFVGSDSFDYTIEDEAGNTSTSTVSVSVGEGDGDPRIDTDVFPVDPTLQPLDPLDGQDEDPDPEDDRDLVNGTDAAETFSTGDDSDTIIAGGGNDTIEGGIDDDLISGGAGDDLITDVQGADTVEGGSGDDTITVGTDTFSDYEGDDPNFGPGTFLTDTLGFTSDGNTDDGRDSVLGGAGNDVIETGDDSDTIYGGTGNDTIDAGIDDDLVYGGSGDDSILGGHGSDSIYGEDGNDYIDASAATSGLDFSNEPDATDPVPENDRDYVEGGAGNDTILTGDDADTIRGGAGDDVIDAGIDDDDIIGGTGNDSIMGGAGDDTIVGALGDDTMIGGDGADYMDGVVGDDLFSGGGGADTMLGGQGRDTFTDISGGDVVDGGSGPGGEREDGIPNDWDTLDLTGAALTENPNGTLNVTYTSDDREDGFVEFRDEDGNITSTMEFEEIENVVPCFTPGTAIATPRGERLVEDLKVGDKIITRDNGIQEIRWIGQRQMSGHELARAPHLRPILIQKGSLGHNLPEHDILVSPQHRLLINNDRTSLYFEETEVLAAAKHLTDLKGVDEVGTLGVTYVHFMFDNHEVVLSNGAWTESFQPGQTVIDGLGTEQRQEIFELFPELETEDGVKDYAAARRSLKKHEAKLLVR